MWGVEDEPQPAHAAIAPPGVHTDAVLTQPRLQALIHVYTHTHKHFRLFSAVKAIRRQTSSKTPFIYLRPDPEWAHQKTDKLFKDGSVLWS